MPLSSTLTPIKNNWSSSLLCKPTISQCGIGIIRQSKEINGFLTEGIWYLGSERNFNKILNIQRQIKYFKIQLLLLTMMPLPWLLVFSPAPPSSWQGRPWTACPWGRNHQILLLICNGNVTNSDSICIVAGSSSSLTPSFTCEISAFPHIPESLCYSQWSPLFSLSYGYLPVYLQTSQPVCMYKWRSI